MSSSSTTICSTSTWPVIRWDVADAPPFTIPFEELQLSGNIVPATAGESRDALFRLGPLEETDADGTIPAVEREGPLSSQADPSLLLRRSICEELEEESSSRPPIYLLSLPGTEETGLAFARPGRRPAADRA